MRVSIILFSLVYFVYCQTAPDLPKLPPAFLVNIEANLMEHNKTYNLREFYNTQTGYARYEINTAESFTYIIVDLNKKQQFTIVDELTCTRENIPDTTLTNARSVTDIMLFGEKFNETYLGSDFEVRGVPCDSWISHISFNQTSTTLSNGTIIPSSFHNLTLQYFFTVESWGFRAVNVTRKPVRAVLRGTRTQQGTGAVSVFYHNYEFVNFVPKAPLQSVFQLPPVCVNYPQQIISILKTKSGGGLVAGMFFLGLFIGAGLCGLSIWVYCRRRQQIRDKFNRSESLASRGSTQE